MERCTYKKGNKMDFLRPDGKEIEINSKEEAADHIRKSCNAVSYTHLDVYKRQSN